MQPVAKLVSVAKDRTILELRNQLMDAQLQIHDILNENRLLLRSQRRLQAALDKYEGPHGDVEALVERHTEEKKIWHNQYLQLRIRLHDALRKLDHKEAECLKMFEEHRSFLLKNPQLAQMEAKEKEMLELKERCRVQSEEIANLRDLSARKDSSVARKETDKKRKKKIKQAYSEEKTDLKLPLNSARKSERLESAKEKKSAKAESAKADSAKEKGAEEKPEANDTEVQEKKLTKKLSARKKKK